MVTVHGPSWSGSLNDAPLKENSRPTSTVWVPPALTLGGRFGGGGVGQLTEKDALPVPPAGTFTVRDVPPLTVQFLARPVNATVWLPAGSPLNVTVPLMPVDRPAPPPPGTGRAVG